MTFDQKSKEMDLPARLHKVLVWCLLRLTKGPLLANAELYQRTLLFLDQIKREKGVWWMPWQQEAMKDVILCDKLGGAENRL
jgi:hypothetical protein